MHLKTKQISKLEKDTFYFLSVFGTDIEYKTVKMG